MARVLQRRVSLCEGGSQLPAVQAGVVLRVVEQAVVLAVVAVHVALAVALVRAARDVHMYIMYTSASVAPHMIQSEFQKLKLLILDKILILSDILL
jgi:hypothetical protein